MKGEKQRKLSILILILMLSITSISYATPSDWSLPEIEEAIDYGLVTKSVQGNYQQDISREEFAELSVRLFEVLTGSEIEVDNVSPFIDTNNIEIIKANRLGIVSGVGNRMFAPKDMITREQIAVMFYRTIKAVDESFIGKTP